jgi:diguanylate cyclase
MPRSPTLAHALVPTSATHAFSSTRDLRNELASSERQLRAALRQIDVLRAQQAALQCEVLRLGAVNHQARQLALHDELTGLPNRTLLRDRFGQAAALAIRQGRQAALLFLDLDRFKCVNDALGHAAGDLVLQLAAARLSACLRSSDTACRYGGDEFVVLLPELEGRHSAETVSDKIVATLALPYFLGGATIEVTTSVGLAFYPDDGIEYGELIRVSDLAMYRNKARARAPLAPDHVSRLPVVAANASGLAATSSPGAEKTSPCNASGT